MENKESYKRIIVEECGFNDRILNWAKSEGILNLYELIEALTKKENEKLEFQTKHPDDNSASFTCFNDDALNTILGNESYAKTLHTDIDIDNVITLTDKDGNDVKFEFLDLIDYQDEEYVILLPVEDDNKEVVILKVDYTQSDSDEESYESVDDEKVLVEIFRIFKEKFKDVFTFED